MLIIRDVENGDNHSFTGVILDKLGVQSRIKKRCISCGKTLRFVHVRLRGVQALVEKAIPHQVVFLSPPTVCAQVLGIEPLLNLGQGVTDVGINTLFFFDLFD